jgi:FkbM family methyltransferase
MQMSIYSVLKRKTNTAIKAYRDGGAKGLLAQVRRKTHVWRVCFAARDVKSVVLDGSRFSLEMIPNNAFKVSLLEGRYERFERRAVLKYVRPELPVVELGACIGVVACITNAILNNRAAHVVVEANPQVIPILRKNCDVNNCKFEILNAAIAYGHTSVEFAPASDFRGSSLRRDDERSYDKALITVTATGLGTIVAQKGFEQFTLICDIEGHEFELVILDTETLRRVDTMILETHARLIGEAKTNELMERLSELGFRTIDQDAFVVVMRRNAVN